MFGDLLISCIPIKKAAKPVWANKRLDCLAYWYASSFILLHVKLAVLLLASTSSNVQHGQGVEKAFNACLEISNVALSLPPKSNFFYLKLLGHEFIFHIYNRELKPSLGHLDREGRQEVESAAEIYLVQSAWSSSNGFKSTLNRRVYVVD